MDRVETLVEKLQQQLAAKAAPSELLLTVQMIQSELQHLQQSHPETDVMPVAFDLPQGTPHLSVSPEVPEPNEKVVLELDIDEGAMAAELEQIKADAEARMSASVKNRPPLIFDSIEEIPTLVHQQPLLSSEPNKPMAVTESNDAALEQTDVSSAAPINTPPLTQSDSLNEALAETPIKDLRKAFGINDRFLYINELFNGNEAVFDRSIKTINAFGAYGEAELWMRRELLHTFGWDEKNEIVKQFYQLVRRRFSQI